MSMILQCSAGEMKADLIAEWTPKSLPAMVMSTSSGPKDYFKNQIRSIFDQVPQADRILMVRGCGPPFLLIHGSFGWRDVAANVVQVQVSNERR
jgi:hypothetical protein